VQRVDPHRDVVLGVHMTSVPVMLLERAREIGDPGQHPIAPHALDGRDIDLETDVVEAARTLHADVIGDR
jgi:hypothetical protein